MHYTEFITRSVMTLTMPNSLNVKTSVTVLYVLLFCSSNLLYKLLYIFFCKI